MIAVLLRLRCRDQRNQQKHSTKSMAPKRFTCTQVNVSSEHCKSLRKQMFPDMEQEQQHRSHTAAKHQQTNILRLPRNASFGTETIARKRNDHIWSYSAFGTPLTYRRQAPTDQYSATTSKRVFRHRNDREKTKRPRLELRSTRNRNAREGKRTFAYVNRNSPSIRACASKTTVAELMQRIERSPC